MTRNIFSSRFLAVLAIVFCLILPAEALAQANSGFSLVPCGTSVNPNPCQFGDLIVAAVRIINLLLAASGIVAVYYIITAAWGMVSAMGNTEKITSSKEAVSRAIIGFGMILVSFALINLLVQGIFGLSDCNWWSQPSKLWSDQSCLLKK